MHWHFALGSVIYDKRRHLSVDCDYPCVDYGVWLQGRKWKSQWADECDWHQGGWHGKGACKAHPHFSSGMMLSHTLITEQRRLMGGRDGTADCDLRASRSGTDRDGFTVAQAWNCFSFPLELSWKCLRLQTISKRQPSQNPRAKNHESSEAGEKTLDYLEQKKKNR